MCFITDQYISRVQGYTRQWHIYFCFLFLFLFYIVSMRFIILTSYLKSVTDLVTQAILDPERDGVGR